MKSCSSDIKEQKAQGSAAAAPVVDVVFGVIM